jgi:hypothetical protein
VRGLAFATPTLYVSVTEHHKIYALDVTQNPVSSYVLAATTGTASATSADLVSPTALALELDSITSAPLNLFIGAGGAQTKRILKLNFGAL